MRTRLARYSLSPISLLGASGLALTLLLCGAVSVCHTLAAPSEKEFSPYVASDGQISLPKDYRDTFAHLGTWSVAKKKDEPVHELHHVYARKADIAAFRKDGKFPDGATLVKEITNVTSAALTTGESSWSTDTTIWFVMIKDAKGRFAGNDLWGDGWGWALFNSDDPARNVATDYTTDCKTCHIPAKQDDWVYVRGYPSLGKNAGKPPAGK